MSRRSPSRPVHRPRHRLDGPVRARTLPVVAVVVAAAIAVGVWASSSGPLHDAGPLSVAVIGDSISAGTPQGGLGATNWTRLLGAQRRWDVVNTSIGGTGYLNPGPAAPFRAAQLETVVNSRPRIVIVEGSRTTSRCRSTRCPRRPPSSTATSRPGCPVSASSPWARSSTAHPATTRWSGSTPSPRPPRRPASRGSTRCARAGSPGRTTRAAASSDPTECTPPTPATRSTPTVWTPPSAASASDAGRSGVTRVISEHRG